MQPGAHRGKTTARDIHETPPPKDTHAILQFHIASLTNLNEHAKALGEEISDLMFIASMSRDPS